MPIRAKRKIVISSCLGPMTSPGNSLPQDSQYHTYFYDCEVDLKFDQNVIGYHGEQN